LNNERALFAKDWQRLVDHAQREKSELVLLPEMPFDRWLFTTREFDDSVWRAAEQAHQEWQARLADFAPATVLSTSPYTHLNERLNGGFVWEADTGYKIIHDKFYLPDEDGFWEASWYLRGDGDFEVAQTDGACVGFAICSELWFFEHSRAYGRQGVEIVLTPRCTGNESVEKWLMGGRAAAVVSGAFSLSSNRSGSEGAVHFGGGGWIIDPDGKVLAVTSAEQPFVTMEIDLEQARQAKRTYPRYIPE
jgi:N-carbamoylputrescine amidase